jgi:two-component system, probable response regulator PhcQ
MKGTILIVDDEEKIIRSINRMLMDDNFRLINATSGEDALPMFQDHSVDLVISDHKMPGMNGIDFLEIIHTEYPDVLTILMTAYADIEMAVSAVNEAGIYKFILKPWKTEEFRTIIQRAMKQKNILAAQNSTKHKVSIRDAMLRKLEREHPGITKVNRDENGCVLFPQH